MPVPGAEPGHVDVITGIQDVFLLGDADRLVVLDDHGGCGRLAAGPSLSGMAGADERPPAVHGPITGHDACLAVKAPLATS
jgi:hypothetical protein